MLIPNKDKNGSYTIKMTTTGYLDYSVRVTCPHCNGRLNLNQEPYTDEEYGDKLGMAIFGSTTVPAQWKNIGIEYRCNHCKMMFLLDRIEY